MTKSKLCNYDRSEHKDGWTVWYEKDSDEIVCTLSIAEHDRQMWIGAVYVSPSYRHKGLCTALLDYAVFNGGDHLAVRKSNTPALSAYTNYGFKRYDEDKLNYYMVLKSGKDDTE